MTLQPRVVVVHRRSEYDEMLIRHGTRQAAAFFLETRGRDIDSVASQHQTLETARRHVAASIPAAWRRAEVERSDIHRFSFAPEDVLVAVGQDGLVANVAKYLHGQPVIGVNPDPARNSGVLVQHPPEHVAAALAAVTTDRGTIERRTMVTASTDDGQTLFALNELYFGHRTHQSARYRVLLPDGRSERHSSSGVLVGTGTGATGWLRSAWQERQSTLRLPLPQDLDLCWFVREAWPSAVTGTDLTEGALSPGEPLELRSESDELVCFGDGIEADSLRISWGQKVTITTAEHALVLVAG